MAFRPTPEQALRTFIGRVQARFPGAGEDFDEEKVEASIKGAKLPEANVPADARFPNVSQSQHCWTKFNEHILCMKKSGGDEAQCNKFRRHYRTVCPNEWVENWEDHIDAGVFMGIKPE
eukprot:CAMPEP_0203813138 /NCGR_PEP_ID=MMETSP0115-20131106/4549_1 /ASSEMBLY_ACC=CAM_ASM_000227 /TAXON_ID=33651 /ORGANISM="Bicosoecid sp, Strain ms1" /LENGTH=118 /DNA_ID=CAMNT_0050721997 /DNA_START=39 /DNA_END=395 /DNA_ORIENTATION=+